MEGLGAVGQASANVTKNVQHLFEERRRIGVIHGNDPSQLMHDTTLSYRSVDPGWRPEYPTLAALLELGAARSTRCGLAISG